MGKASGQKGPGAIPYGAAHTYMAYMRECPPRPRVLDSCCFLRNSYIEEYFFWDLDFNSVLVSTCCCWSIVGVKKLEFSWFFKLNLLLSDSVSQWVNKKKARARYDSRYPVILPPNHLPALYMMASRLLGGEMVWWRDNGKPINIHLYMNGTLAGN